jgi:1,4-dihydroxy-6-naphthoate synthase
LDDAENAVLRVGYTPDSDDVINFYAWEHGRVTLAGWQATFDRDCISSLNRSAEAQLYDVVSISSACYPWIAENYWILAAGSSVGRGYGPVLVAKDPLSIDWLRGKRIAVGGFNTTGAALAKMYCPGAKQIEMRYDQIADAVLTGIVDAGVMIHEELLFFTQKGLSRVCDLGRRWCEETGGPLPVGLNVVHKRVGRGTARAINSTCRKSLRWGLDHRDEALAYAATFGRGCTPQFVGMFSNADTLCMPEDVERALGLVFSRFASLGISPSLTDYEVIRDEH